MSVACSQSCRSRKIFPCAVAALVVFLICANFVAADTGAGNNLSDRINVSGRLAHTWPDTDGSQVTVMWGQCRVKQGETVITARQMVVWQSQFNGRDRVELYLEDDVVITRPGQTHSQQSAWLELWTEAGVVGKARLRGDYDKATGDPLFERASRRRRASVGPKFIQTQLLELPPPGLPFRAHRFEQSDTPIRRVRLYARTGQPFSFRTERSTQTTPAEQVAIVTGGIKLNVDSPQPDGSPDPEGIELAADSMVLWTESSELTDLTAGREEIQNRDTPLQIYLEGNIVIRQQNSILIADRAYYDARQERALLIDAELKMIIPEADNYLRVRANRIRQLNAGAFHAQQAWMSASIFGKPGYRVDATDVFLEPRVINPWVKANGGRIDPITGEIDDGVVNWLTMLNNTFVLSDVPFFYLPYLSGPAEDPHLPITKFTIGSDSIFGNKIETAWDPFHLLARDSPEELTTSLLLNWYSERGPSIGLEGAYDGTDLLGRNDSYKGYFQTNYVHDRGQDNLGGRRRRLIPDTENRGRVTARHIHSLPGSLSVIAEAGYVTDRNYIEQWFEPEFASGKDQETKLAVEQRINNVAWSIQGRPQVNDDFDYTTEWLPKVDLHVLGQPVYGTPLLWSMHASAGYAHIRTPDRPSDPVDAIAFTPIPYYSNANDAVIHNRQELTMPFNAGPVVLSPFVMGESAYWSDDLSGNSLGRLVGSFGLRGSLSMLKVLPYVCSDIFNLDGLAHRMVFDFEYSYTDSSQDVSRIPQYNEIDDNAQERFRLRYPINTFGGLAPTFPTFSGNTPQFLDPRRYAIRSGAGSLVSVPYNELVDDLQVVRLGWRHRLQTKVGPPDRRRIRDWMTLDLNASVFPRAGHHSPAGRDFAEDWGLVSADYRWLASERTAFVASTLYDTFDGGQQLWSAGIHSQRSARGSVYVGVHQIKALGLDSQLATVRASYLLSDKWLATGSTAYDLRENQQRGDSITLTRIGGDFLFHFGFGYDRTKDAVQATVSFEPRFGSRSRYSERMGELLSAPR